MDAPNAAPEEIPITYGSAIGFLTYLEKQQPAMERLAPTNTPNSTLGNLMSKL